MARTGQLTPARLKALQLIGRENGITCRWFAAAMWPAGFRHLGKCGPNGSAYGIGATQKAGQFLRRLSNDGLVSCQPSSHHGANRYHLTDAGRQALEGAA